MPYRIVWHRDKPAPWNKAWVRSIRSDGSFRYTYVPQLAKAWTRRSAPSKAISRNQALGLVPKVYSVELFFDPTEADPVVIPFEELEEHGLL